MLGGTQPAWAWHGIDLGKATVEVLLVCPLERQIPDSTAVLSRRHHGSAQHTQPTTVFHAAAAGEPADTCPGWPT